MAMSTSNLYQNNDPGKDGVVQVANVDAQQLANVNASDVKVCNAAWQPTWSSDGYVTMTHTASGKVVVLRDDGVVEV